jgi:hypothetical protein
VLSYGKFSATGAAALAIGSVVLNQLYLLAAAAVVVAAAAVTVRLAWRRGKAAGDR